MAQYRKKPVVIEAFRYGMDSRPDWFDTKVTNNEIITHTGTDLRDPSGYWCEIKTLEGVMRGDCGDYIIKGVKGEVYPCKPDVFEMTYEEESSVTITPPDLMSNIIPNYPLHNFVKHTSATGNTGAVDNGKCQICGLESWQHYTINFK